MKLNWGNSIAIILVLFAVACITFVFYTRTLDFTLVEDDYYPKELRHEEVLVKMRNYNDLQQSLQAGLAKDSAFVLFPSFFKGKTLTGNIMIYRPSDKKLDFFVQVKVDSTLTQKIPLVKFKHGNYVVKADWNCEGKGYYREVELFVP
ncbi:MAG: FixH family protein [Bacteroidota bacterium]